MLISELDFTLPPELIAQQAAEPRDSSRMLVVDRDDQSFADKCFLDLPSLMRKDDLLVLNNTKVFPARLHGITSTGASVEVFLIDQNADGTWNVLAKPAKRLPFGKKITFDEHLHAEAAARSADGKVILRFFADGDLFEIIEQVGKTPLPPYIHREKAGLDSDRDRYQTIYASERGAVAAPTAGLHFTQRTFDELRACGVESAYITLHVGYGTFEPVRSATAEEHTVAPERFFIDERTAESINKAKKENRRIVAVGTTTTRALESSALAEGIVTAGEQTAGLAIKPGHRFRIVDALLTNFHLPKSSLLMLTSTFGGHTLVMSAYRHAVEQRYRFYSYGDCMLIV
ncbi:MAG: tRNA preQ1(34) S-adenosylmethionine ribosyltransferase-isomerase QueA [Acidobacteria bacterium]|nr:tRNA preQ1(34) S-adenosylmethionine ribosyltransferase-isomerase QueA [Acidobacteriota bacterium]